MMNNLRTRRAERGAALPRPHTAAIAIPDIKFYSVLIMAEVGEPFAFTSPEARHLIRSDTLPFQDGPVRGLQKWATRAADIRLPVTWIPPSCPIAEQLLWRTYPVHEKTAELEELIQLTELDIIASSEDDSVQNLRYKALFEVIKDQRSLYSDKYGESFIPFFLYDLGAATVQGLAAMKAGRHRLFLSAMPGVTGDLRLLERPFCEVQNMLRAVDAHPGLENLLDTLAQKYLPGDEYARQNIYAGSLCGLVQVEACVAAVEVEHTHQMLRIPSSI